MDKLDKIFFVSMDDTGIGPMAQAICKSLVTDDRWQILSRGLIVHFSEPINPKVLDILKNNNIKEVKQASRQFEPAEITKNSLLLTMSEREKKILINDYNLEKEQVYIITEYVEEFSEITDPYGENMAGYDRCYCELVRVVKKLVYKLS